MQNRCSHSLRDSAVASPSHGDSRWGRFRRWLLLFATFLVSEPFSAGALWGSTLDTPTILVQSNATWALLKGRAEASNPTDAWRFLAFDHSNWSNALAPFYYGDPYNTAEHPGTPLSDMRGSYSSIYLRKEFLLSNAGAVSNVYFSAQSDDGFVAWINGVEVWRYHVPAGEVAYNTAATASASEPNDKGAGYLLYTSSDASRYLVSGTNLLAVHAFNYNPASSTDFGFNAQLYTDLADPSAVPPFSPRSCQRPARCSP